MNGVGQLEFRLQPLHRVEAESVIEQCIGRPFICAQWRTEWIRNGGIVDCTRSFVTAVRDARQRLRRERGGTNVNLHIATDLIDGNSDTYETSGLHTRGDRQRALQYTWSLLQPEARATAYLNTIRDAGHRAIIEMMICAASDLFVTGTKCTMRGCKACSKSNSAFGARILNMRSSATPPRISDHRGWNRSMFHRSTNNVVAPDFHEILSTNK